MAKLDFYDIREDRKKEGQISIYPSFRVRRSKDLMFKDGAFYAVWDEEKNLWSKDEYDVQRLIDADLAAYREELIQRNEGIVSCQYMGDFSSGSWLKFRSFVKNISDSYHPLDANLTFSNTEVTKEDFVTRRLPYPLAPGDISAWDEIVGTLYDPVEREKIEWGIGAIVSGDSQTIQKFFVLYGAPGTGKSTILAIIEKLFAGYTAQFDAKALTSGNNQFAMDVFRDDPLVGVQHDGDLSKIADNTKLNSIVSHEPMSMNEKFKASRTAAIRAMLWMGTNSAVRITDAKAGIIRRLIDIQPTGAKLAPRRYAVLVDQVNFELGAIAHHCLEVYKSLGRNKYSGYQAIEMMLQTDVFFNFVEENFDLFEAQDGVSLAQAHDLYKEFCKDNALEFVMPKYKLREELKNYFDKFEERAMIDNVRVRSWYSGFNAQRWKAKVEDAPEPMAYSLVLEETESLLDKDLSEFPAQYTNANGDPKKYWDNSERRDKKTGKPFIPKPSQVCNTFLKDLDTTKEHYTKVPVNHIVIDFDITDADGEKSLERNLEAASKWPATYAEYSKSGSGVHLHYIYEGDVNQLSRVYDDNIEVKVYSGNSALRRRLSKCNNIPVATISSGLPLKPKENKVLSDESIKSEKSLRNLIERNLKKEIHKSTKPSVDFIAKILEECYYSDLVYNVEDLYPRVMVFANNSTNQAREALNVVAGMKWKSEDVEPNPISSEQVDKQFKEAPVVYYDVEVFPNLFVICWKYAEDDVVTRMINPTAQQVEQLLKFKLVGFYNRKYDNHILWAAYLGYSLDALYKLSQMLIANEKSAPFAAAYNLSYADIYDYSSIKQSLKKFQNQLGLKHDELNLPWDKPVPEEMWERVAEYCENDVRTTEAVAEDRAADFRARLILAELSGLEPNQPTAKHTAKIIFGDDRNAKDKFVYTDLSEEFPGYEYRYNPEKKRMESYYSGEPDVGEGGYVYAEPGIYYNVGLLDVASMHPTSLKELNLFGPYTDKFWDLVRARLAIKHGDYDAAGEMLDGKLAPYLGAQEEAEALSYALKIVINIVYGLTSAKFENPFNDIRNKDNIVAKRGALFMVDLKQHVQDLGYTVVHIKTDSIKIAEMDDFIKNEVMEFGARYGYVFEHEATYEKMALINDAVYVAKVGWAPNPKKIGTWTATGARFKHPYVFKTLFSHEPIEFRDKCEEKQVTTAMYLDFTTVDDPLALTTDESRLKFVGKHGMFCPIKETKGGAALVREKDGEYGAVTGSKGFYWLESNMVEQLGLEDEIDLDYFRGLVDESKEKIAQFGDVEEFLA